MLNECKMKEIPDVIFFLQFAYLHVCVNTTSCCPFINDSAFAFKLVLLSMNGSFVKMLDK